MLITCLCRRSLMAGLYCAGLPSIVRFVSVPTLLPLHPPVILIFSIGIVVFAVPPSRTFVQVRAASRVAPLSQRTPKSQQTSTSVVPCACATVQSTDGPCTTSQLTFARTFSPQPARSTTSTTDLIARMYRGPRVATEHGG